MPRAPAFSDTGCEGVTREVPSKRDGIRKGSFVFQANEKGEFQSPENLAPGAWILFAAAPESFLAPDSPDGQQRLGWAVTYYPHEASAALASPVSVSAGGAVSELEIKLTTVPANWRAGCHPAQMRLIAFYGVLAVNLFAADFTPFDYDRSFPLDPHERELSVLNGTRVALLNFAVTPSMRADGLLVTPPPGKSKAGAIVWVHSSGAFQQLPDAMLLAQAGAVSLLINPIGPDWDQPAETWRGPMINAVISIRRGSTCCCKEATSTRDGWDSPATVMAR